MPSRFFFILMLISYTAVFAKPSHTFQFDSFGDYVNTALSDTQAMDDFEAITAEVENNIFWKKKAHENKYHSAFKRSSPFLKNMLRDDVPDFVFLIPYLESGWHPTKGNPNSDYGYWQMVTDVINEIKRLDQVSDRLRNTHPDIIRSDPQLSTEAALIHLKRYYFYFRHVANFEEADAWLFSVTAYNWGAGNIKRMLEKLVTKKTEETGSSILTFADFYHYLFVSTQRYPNDKSMRVALEYLPNLWNLALLIQMAQSSDAESENNALTLNRSSAVSIP